MRNLAAAAVAAVVLIGAAASSGCEQGRDATGYAAQLKSRITVEAIARYLNFDMIASPNTCYFTSDGNLSAKPDYDLGPQLTPEGSAGIERSLVDAFAQ